MAMQALDEAVVRVSAQRGQRHSLQAAGTG